MHPARTQNNQKTIKIDPKQSKNNQKQQPPGRGSAPGAPPRAAPLLFQKIILKEVAPQVKAVPSITPENYVDLVHKRFSNPKIIDTTRRVAFDGSSRHPGFLMPSIRDGLANDTPIDGLTLIQASWARMCEGTREDGTLIAPNDPFWDELQAKAKVARSNPSVWLEMDQIYGNLAKEPRFANSFETWFGIIWDQGLDKAIEIYLEV